MINECPNHCDALHRNYGYHGMIVGNGSSNIVFESCDFAWLGGGYDGNGTNASDGYAIEFLSGITDSTIRFCTFSDIYNFAVSLQSWGSDAYTFADIYVYGNTMTGCGCGGFENWYASTGVQDVSNVVFARNVVYGTALSKFRMPQVPYVFSITGATGGNVSMSGCKVVDNIFGPTANRYAWLGSTGFLSGWTIDYNCYSPLNDEFAYVGGAKTWSYWKSTLGLDRHSVTSDPLFVNASEGDFRPATNSPCIGAGVFVSGIGASGGPVNIGAS